MTGAAYVQRVREVIADEMATTLEPPRAARLARSHRRRRGRLEGEPLTMAEPE